MWERATKSDYRHPNTWFLTLQNWIKLSDGTSKHNFFLLNIYGTWIILCSLWEERHAEQRAPFTQSKQYILHSLLWESAWTLHWTKKRVLRSGCSHEGHLLFSSSSSFSLTTPSPLKPPTWSHRPRNKKAHKIVNW